MEILTKNYFSIQGFRKGVLLKSNNLTLFDEITDESDLSNNGSVRYRWKNNNSTEIFFSVSITEDLKAFHFGDTSNYLLFISTNLDMVESLFLSKEKSLPLEINRDLIKYSDLLQKAEALSKDDLETIKIHKPMYDVSEGEFQEGTISSDISCFLLEYGSIKEYYECLLIEPNDIDMYDFLDSLFEKIKPIYMEFIFSDFNY